MEDRALRRLGRITTTTITSTIIFHNVFSHIGSELVYNLPRINHPVHSPQSLMTWVNCCHWKKTEDSSLGRYVSTALHNILFEAAAQEALWNTITIQQVLLQLSLMRVEIMTFASRETLNTLNGWSQAWSWLRAERRIPQVVKVEGVLRGCTFQREGPWPRFQERYLIIASSILYILGRR